MQQRNVSRKLPFTVIEVPAWIAIIKVRPHLFLVRVACQHVKRKPAARSLRKSLQRFEYMPFPAHSVVIKLYIKDATRDGKVGSSYAGYFCCELRLEAIRNLRPRCPDHLSRDI